MLIQCVNLINVSLFDCKNKSKAKITHEISFIKVN